MGEVMIAPEELRDVAEKFRTASKNSLKVTKGLEEAMTDLQSKWQGLSQQVFYRDYVEWHEHLVGFVPVLENIAKEIEAIAERFDAADSGDS